MLAELAYIVVGIVSLVTAGGILYITSPGYMHN